MTARLRRARRKEVTPYQRFYKEFKRHSRIWQEPGSVKEPRWRQKENAIKYMSAHGITWYQDQLPF